VLLQREIAIEPGEHAPALLSRLASAGAAVLLETLRRLEAGTLQGRPQVDADATFAPRIAPRDGHADFRRSARELEGKVRGLDPWPGLWALRSGRRIRLAQASALPPGGEVEGEGDEGSVVGFEDDAFLVACGWGSRLAVRAVQPEGRRVMTAREAANGRQLAVGDVLQDPSSLP
jgi:methionyl-tRNA formyltransferase